jgi:hypothetical protein
MMLSRAPELPKFGGCHLFTSTFSPPKEREIEAIEDEIKEVQHEIDSKLNDAYGYGKHDVSGSLQYLKELMRRLANLKSK